MNTIFKIDFEINNKLKDEIVFEKKSSEESNTELIVENDIAIIISKLTALIIDLKKEHKIYQFNFSISLIDANKNVKILFADEKALFSEVKKYDRLSSATIAYLKATDHGEYDSRIWEDCENPLGTEAILSLVTKDKKWMPEYIHFLRTCDLDHEVNQGGDMEKLIEQYGWCEETCALAIARLLTCHGQHGREQFEDFITAGFFDYILTYNNLFIKKLMEEFEYALHNDICYSSYLEYTKDECFEELFEEIEILTEILDENDLEEIKTKLSDIWDTFNAKK